MARDPVPQKGSTVTEPMNRAPQPEPIKPRCTGHSSRTGAPCKLAPVRGTSVCHKHGGSAPQVKRAAARRLIEAEIRDLFGKVSPEIVPVDNPLAAYAEFAGRVMGWMRLMDSLLGELSSVKVTTAAQGEQVRAEVQLYERAMDRANAVLSSYARLNIDTRLAAITEQQAAIVLRAIEAVIDHLGATGSDAAEARRVGAAHLRLVGDAS